MPSPTPGNYWLIHPTNSALNVKLSIVISDEYEDEYEETTHLVINRGRKKEYGEHWGIKGTLTAQIRDETGRTAREAKQQLEALKATQDAITLQTPFGDTYSVTLGSIRIIRMAGVGDREFHDLTLAYEELGT